MSVADTGLLGSRMTNVAKLSNRVLVLSFVLVVSHGLSGQAPAAPQGVFTGTTEAGPQQTVGASESGVGSRQTGPVPLSAAPQVTYENGLLSINASNSTWSQVFSAIQRVTGATIEYPVSAANERIVVQLGPGKPKDVIKELLNGSSFDYILTGVPGDSGRVRSLVLTAQNAPRAGSVSSAPQKTPAQLGDAKAGKVKTTAVARRTTSDGRPAEPAILPVGTGNHSAKVNTPIPTALNDPERMAQVNRWLQLDKEHEQRMADPANKDLPPPPPPPMEPPPPTPN